MGARDSFWSRRVPVDLSSEVEKKTLFIKASLQTARFFFFRLVFFFLLFFFKHSTPWPRHEKDCPHQCSGGSRDNGQMRNRDEVESIST